MNIASTSQFRPQGPVLASRIPTLSSNFPCRPQKSSTTRNFLVFPAKLDQRKSPLEAFPFTTYTITDLEFRHHYNPSLSQDLSDISVRSASYYKQKQNSQHEFIVFSVATSSGMQNFMALGRNVAVQGLRSLLPRRNKNAHASMTRDYFHISHYGEIEPLINHCAHTTSEDMCNHVEQVVFKRKDFLFAEPLVLANTVSNLNSCPSYQLEAANCYWFASLIWECMLGEFEKGILIHKKYSDDRGRFKGFRIQGNHSNFVQVMQKYKEDIALFENDTLCFGHFDTTFGIARATTYSRIDTLTDEARARIISEMMHGLFHAYLPFDEYERINEGKWGAGGCKCKQCQLNAPLVLEFALGNDVRDNILERGAMRALVDMYGEGWTTSEFLALPLGLKGTLLKAVKYRVRPGNIIPLLLATHAGLNKLSSISKPSAEEVRVLMLRVRNKIDKVLCSDFCDFLEQPEWVSLLQSGAVDFDDVDKIDLILESVKRGLTDQDIGLIYQTLVSSVLLHEGPTPDSTILSSHFPLRAKIEQLKLDIIIWMKKHWTSVQMTGCFDDLEIWALKAIGDELDIPMKDLNAIRFSRSDAVETGRERVAPSIDPVHVHDRSTTGVLNLVVPARPRRQRRAAIGSGDVVGPDPLNNPLGHPELPMFSISPAGSNVHNSHKTNNSLIKELDLVHSLPAEMSASTTSISRQMIAHEVVFHLVAHGCQDLTNDVDCATFAEHPICHGGFSDVYRGRLLDNKQVAIKALRISFTENSKHLKHAARELDTWSKCIHSNVLQLYGLAVFRGRIGMVSPWMEKGNLPRYLRETPSVDRCYLCSQVCDGLSYMHQAGIIHGDLKGANVLISDNGVPVLADFGNSLYSNRTMKFTDTTSTGSLTVRWSAAELITGLSNHTKASDVYALAMTIYETLAGILPYNDKREQTIIYLVVTKQEPPERPESIPVGREGNMLWNLLLRCWSFKPEARPSASDVGEIMKTVNSNSLINSDGLSPVNVSL